MFSGGAIVAYTEDAFWMIVEGKLQRATFKDNPEHKNLIETSSERISRVKFEGAVPRKLTANEHLDIAMYLATFKDLPFKKL
jgi:hypothetical protein